MTQDLGGDVAGVELDPRGYVRLNERLETTAPGVWAMRDGAGSPQFTHVSYDDFLIVRDNLAGGQRTTRDRPVLYCVFTDPELARRPERNGSEGAGGRLSRRSDTHAGGGAREPRRRAGVS